MKNYKLFLSLPACFLFSVSVVAEPPKKPEGRPDLSGEITLQSTVQETKAPYLTSQDLAIEYTEKVLEAMKQLSQGGAGQAPSLDEKAVPFMNAAYLYCSIQIGICQHLLDTMLESDLIASKQSGKVECPTLTKFWKSYIAGDLESRHKFQTPITYVGISEEFATKTRPKYLKCKSTIQLEIDAAGGDFFKTRYADGKKIAQINKSVEFLKRAKSENKNVFTEVGIALGGGK